MNSAIPCRIRDFSFRKQIHIHESGPRPGPCHPQKQEERQRRKKKKRPAWGRSLFLGGESDAVPKFRSHVLSDDSEPRNLLQQTLVKLLIGRRFHAVFLAPFRVSEKQFFPGIRKARADLAAFGKKPGNI